MFRTIQNNLNPSLSLSLYKYSVHVLKDILCDLVHSVPDDRYNCI